MSICIFAVQCERTFQWMCHSSCFTFNRKLSYRLVFCPTYYILMNIKRQPYIIIYNTYSILMAFHLLTTAIRISYKHLRKWDLKTCANFRTWIMQSNILYIYSMLVVHFMMRIIVITQERAQQKNIKIEVFTRRNWEFFFFVGLEPNERTTEKGLDINMWQKLKSFVIVRCKQKQNKKHNFEKRLLFGWYIFHQYWCWISPKSWIGWPTHLAGLWISKIAKSKRKLIEVVADKVGCIMLGLAQAFLSSIFFFHFFFHKKGRSMPLYR